MNSVVLIGRLTRDPEVRYTSGSQMAVCTFSIAIDRPTRQGEEKKTDFPKVTVFGKQAENCERFLKKGRLVGVQGRLQTGSYTNKDGATVYTTDVVADRVEFLEWGDNNPQQAPQYTPQYQQPQYTPQTPMYTPQTPQYQAPPQYVAPQTPQYQAPMQPTADPTTQGVQQEFVPEGFAHIEEDIPF